MLYLATYKLLHPTQNTFRQRPFHVAATSLPRVTASHTLRLLTGSLNAACAFGLVFRSFWRHELRVAKIPRRSMASIVHLLRSNVEAWSNPAEKDPPGPSEPPKPHAKPKEPASAELIRMPAVPSVSPTSHPSQSSSWLSSAPIALTSPNAPAREEIVGCAA